MYLISRFASWGRLGWPEGRSRSLMSLFVVGPDRVSLIERLVKFRLDDSKKSSSRIRLLH